MSNIVLFFLPTDCTDYADFFRVIRVIRGLCIIRQAKYKSLAMQKNRRKLLSKSSKRFIKVVSTICLNRLDDFYLFRDCGSKPAMTH